MKGIPPQIDALFRRSGIKGLSAVIFDAEDRWAWTLGDGGDGPVEAETCFPIASCTKPITASAVLALRAAGAFELDDRICDIIPGFKLHDAAARAAITVRDLLCHRSGLPPHTWAWVYGELDRADFIRERLPHLASVGPFREKYRYSNLGYAIAGHLIQVTTGRSWEAYLDQEIFAPLGMGHTSHLDEHWLDTPQLARPHDPSGTPMPGFAAKANHLIAPASELMSTAGDLATWLQAHIKTPTFRTMIEPQVAIESDCQPKGPLGPLQYGLGWRLDTIAGEPQVWHSGLCSGYSAWMSVMPERKTGIILLSNTDRSLGWIKSMAYGFFHPEIDWTDTFIKPRAATAPTPAEPCTASSNWNGRYLHPGYGLFRVEQDQAWYQGQGPFELRFQDASVARFQLSGYPAEFEVCFSEDGLVIPFESQLPPIRFGRI